MSLPIRPKSSLNFNSFAGLRRLGSSSVDGVRCCVEDTCSRSRVRYVENLGDNNNNSGGSLGDFKAGDDNNNIVEVVGSTVALPLATIMAMERLNLSTSSTNDSGGSRSTNDIINSIKDIVHNDYDAKNSSNVSSESGLEGEGEGEGEGDYVATSDTSSNRTYNRNVFESYTFEAVFAEQLLAASEAHNCRRFLVKNPGGTSSVYITILSTRHYVASRYFSPYCSKSDSLALVPAMKVWFECDRNEELDAVEW
eukprot:CAMPEP_0197542116 /NCGR_PEP_ID=MMETSP1318-20131121/67533_1 /TAXON_ID=552666 /ORGANISM="Partenskyella glossopodia, Strain RCC365" /LENGTH=252 /DNA_ID=CAMNT_0043101359 /DNA_START=454 /DNA_END=1209 /DNA_ORIENTATION=-